MIRSHDLLEDYQSNLEVGMLCRDAGSRGRAARRQQSPAGAVADGAVGEEDEEDEEERTGRSGTALGSFRFPQCPGEKDGFHKAPERKSHGEKKGACFHKARRERGGALQLQALVRRDFRMFCALRGMRRGEA